MGVLYVSRVVTTAPDLLVQVLFVGVMAAIIYLLSWPVVSFQVTHWIPSLVIGAVVFALWIAPDLLFPGFRHHWLFENPVLGKIQSSLPEAARSNAGVLLFRSLRAVVIVPIVEELFWRGWLMRWLIKPDFEQVPLGQWSAAAFSITAVLFASEHGSFWEVGLVAGIVYNWWMVRTGSLGDLILVHAVTNGLLCAEVILTGKWEYWG